MPAFSPASILADLTPAPDWASLPLFDRSGWKRVRFGDVVRQLKEQVDPEADGIERYVAGEHMETENVHIRKWGVVGDGYLGPAFIRGFRKGQVLYGSRRTYLKKVAVAEWDGVTANTTFVLEAVEGKLLQDLLPWLMLSDRFTRHSVAESKGSTNPYINFPDIAKFEFDLPPLDQQRRIAEILWAVDEAIERQRELLESCRCYEDAFVLGRMGQKSAVIENLVNRQEYDADGWLVATGQVLLDRGVLEALKDGNHGEQYPRSSEFSKAGTPYVAASNVTDDGKIDFDGCPKLTDAVKERLRIPPARGGDVLLTHNATVGRVAVIPAWQREVVASTTTTYYRVDPERLSNRYLAAYLRTHLFQSQLHRVMKQSTRDQVPITAQKKLLFVVPPLTFQESFVHSVVQIQNTIALASKHLAAFQHLSQRLTNAIVT